MIPPHLTDLHAVLDQNFRQVLAAALYRNITASGKAVADVARHLGRELPEPLVSGMLVWNFMLNALQEVAERHPDLDLTVPARGRVRLFHYRGLPFIPYRIHTKATEDGRVGITATEKKYVARLLGDHLQIQLFDDENNAEPLPAIFAYDVQSAPSDDGTLAMRLDDAYFAYPTSACVQGALTVPFGPKAVKIFPVPLVAVEMEEDRKVDSTRFKVKLVKSEDGEIEG